MELPFGFRRMSQLMEGGVMGAPLQERLRSKFGILKNDKVMYKMELDGSGVSIDVEDKHDFDDFTNYLKVRGSVVMNRSGKVTVRVKKAARVQQLRGEVWRQQPHARSDVKKMNDLKVAAGCVKGAVPLEIDQSQFQQALARGGV